MKKIFAGLLLLFCCGVSYAQLPEAIRRGQSTFSNAGNHSTKADSLGIGFEHRDDAKDSITLSYKFLDSVRNIKLDSSLNDFYKYYFILPAGQQYLGNDGAAGYSLIYTPFMKAGWDAGFHAFDAYRYTLEESRYFKTTKPFTQLNYQLASGKEQLIKILHTQNPRPNFNFGFEYKLISAPGFFVTQNSNISNYRIFSNYQGKRKRYALFLTLINNSIKNSENGGMKNDSLLTDINHAKRYTIPVNLGGDVLYEPNPFKSNVNTGNIYKDFTFFLRQTYDVGKKDSIAINDSTTEYLFYPKLRFQYSFTYNTYNYKFVDLAADSTIYQNWYDQTLPKQTDTFQVRDKWRMLSNDLSLIQFPDTKNAAQFFLAGVRIENIKGEFETATRYYNNIIIHGEYRNKTRNKLWDIFARGEFYLNGLNSGDYSAYGTLARTGKRLGSVRLTFNNVNRSPSFIYNQLSSFNNSPSSFKKENITLIKASADNSFISLSVSDYILSNLLYFKDYYHTEQSGKVFNLLQVSASKKIPLGKKWSWYLDVVLQQTDGSAPVKVPLLYTRNRFAFEGVYYKNLTYSTGIELRYYTGYNAYNYSPVVGQFMPQDSVNIKNLPDISAFFHFRIKSFTAYLRAENLNTVNFSNGLTFTNNNYAAPHYAFSGLIFRLGIQWRFVN